MILHDLKDLVDIYYSDNDNKTSYLWDKTPIVVWLPEQQKYLTLSFAGSSKPQGDSKGQINFIGHMVDNYDQQN